MFHNRRAWAPQEARVMTQRRCAGRDRRLPSLLLARACPWHKNCSFAWLARFPRGVERGNTAPRATQKAQPYRLWEYIEMFSRFSKTVVAAFAVLVVTAPLVLAQTSGSGSS